MKRSMICLVGLVATIYLVGRPALAQHGHGGGAGHSAVSTHGESGKKDPSSAGNKASEALTDNTKLASKLQSLLGSSVVGGPKAPFPSIQVAAQGFKNLGQFVAAVHVSHNLGIPFADLKARMMAGDSLAKSIQTLKPSTNSKQEAKTAQAQADQDLKESSSNPRVAAR